MFIEEFDNLYPLIVDNSTTFISILSVLAICYILYFATKINRTFKMIFVIFSSVIHAVYLVWRVGFTLPLSNYIGLFFAILLISAEILGFTQALTYRMLFLKKPKRETKTISDLGYYPTVDIMITTYNEPDDIIRRTVAGSSQIDYPSDKLNVYVCDDSSRDSIKQICEDYGANWITRQEHKHAKAGNLNNCYINYSSGEFSVILDADMVPSPDFLEKTLGYFYDETVAFTQTPQVFFNPDTFQRNLGLNDQIPNEQDFFMQEVQIQRQEYNALLFVGSGCVFRRSALEEIGFIPTGTITEDMATSLLLQEKYYKGVLTNDTFAQGLSAESFADHVSQRTRWCQGNIEVLKIWNPWKMKNLTFAQKAIITDGVTYWFFGLQKMIYIICPLIFTLTGIPIVKTDILSIMLFWLPSYMMHGMVMNVFSHNNRSASWAHVYETSLSPYLSIAALKALFIKKSRVFKVTPKGLGSDKTVFSFKIALPHLVLASLSLIAIYIAGYNIIKAPNISVVLVFVLNLFWIIYNFVAIFISIILCFERPRVRKHDRINVNKDIPVKFSNSKEYTGSLINISEGGCNISVNNLKNPNTYTGKKITIVVSDTEIEGETLRYIAGKKSFAVKFDRMSKEQYAKLVKFIFTSQSFGFGNLETKSAAKAFASQILNSIKVYFIKRRYRIQHQKAQNQKASIFEKIHYRIRTSNTSKDSQDIVQVDNERLEKNEHIATDKTDVELDIVIKDKEVDLYEEIKSYDDSLITYVAIKQVDFDDDFRFDLTFDEIDNMYEIYELETNKTDKKDNALQPVQELINQAVLDFDFDRKQSESNSLINDILLDNKLSPHNYQGRHEASYDYVYLNAFIEKPSKSHPYIGEHSIEPQSDDYK